MIPEFVGRLPVISPLYPLDDEDLVRIMTEPRNALVQAVPEALRDGRGRARVHARKRSARSPKIAKSKDTGARGLRSVVEEVMLDIMYELPDQGAGKKYVLTPAVIRGEENPERFRGSVSAS